MFALSHVLGARGVRDALVQPLAEWGIRLIDHLQAGRYPDVQRALVRETMPFYNLVEIEPPSRAATAISTSCAWSRSA